MQLYEYRCKVCRTIVTSTTRGDTLGPCQIDGCVGELRRRFVVNTAAVHPRTRFTPHKNLATGMWTSSMAEHRDNLKKLSEQRTLETGIEHNYVPVDRQDRDAAGISGEGVEAHERNKSLQSQGLLK